jgi:hypothetical protein
MSCPRKRFPASTASTKPIDNEAVRTTNAKLAEMMAERDRQDRDAAFTHDKATVTTVTTVTTVANVVTTSSAKTVRIDQ